MPPWHLFKYIKPMRNVVFLSEMKGKDVKLFCCKAMELAISTPDTHVQQVFAPCLEKTSL
jgi:hypothetical protein